MLSIAAACFQIKTVQTWSSKPQEWIEQHRQRKSCRAKLDQISEYTKGPSGNRRKRRYVIRDRQAAN